MLEKYTSPDQPNIPDDHVKAAFDMNLKDAVGMARDPTWSGGLYLGQPEGSEYRVEIELPFYVDAKNRTMLDEIYRLAHVDPEQAIAYEKGDPTDSINGYRYDRLLLSSQGDYAFIEHFAVFPSKIAGSSSEWQRFGVSFAHVSPFILKRFGLEAADNS